MQGWIAGLVRNAFLIHRFDETVGGYASELVLIEVEDVCILPVPSAAFIEFLRCDAGNFAQFAIEHARVLMPAPGLPVESAQLRHKHRALPFAQAVVRSINEVAVEPLARHASAVVDGTGIALECIVVGNDHAAFSGGHQLARLEAEGTGDTVGADPLPSPFTAMSVR